MRRRHFLDITAARCTIPTRIVWGDADSLFAPAAATYLARVLPRITGVSRLPTAKLCFPEQMPDIIASEARLLWRA
jgi:pimeloyl-ACP methyl ester carboxylesterase